MVAVWLVALPSISASLSGAVVVVDVVVVVMGGLYVCCGAGCI